MTSQFRMIRTACNRCDYYLLIPELKAGQSAHCPRCGHLISRLSANCVNRLIAFSITSLLFLILSTQFPFLSFTSQGRIQQITLLQGAFDLVTLHYDFLALILLMFIIIIPGVSLLLCLTIFCCIKVNRWLAIARQMTHWFYKLHPWSMPEVFLIGALVSLVKISSMADIIIGLSFWAYSLFVVFFAATLSQLDRFQLWQRLTPDEP